MNVRRGCTFVRCDVHVKFVWNMFKLKITYSSARPELNSALFFVLLNYSRSSMITYFYSTYNNEQHAHTVAKARKELTFDNNTSRYTLNIHLVFTHDFRSTILFRNAVKIGTVSVT